MTASAVPVPNIDAMHAHFVEWVRYLDAKDVELTTQQTKLEAKKVKTRTDVPAKPSPLESSETTCEMNFLDHVFRAQTRSELEIATLEEHVVRASDGTIASQDDLAQDTDGLESLTEEAHVSGGSVTGPMISSVEDDDLS